MWLLAVLSALAVPATDWQPIAPTAVVDLSQADVVFGDDRLRGCGDPAVFSPSGGQLATTCHGELRVFDRATGEVTLRHAADSALVGDPWWVSEDRLRVGRDEGGLLEVSLDDARWRVVGPDTDGIAMLVGRGEQALAVAGGSTLMHWQGDEVEAIGHVMRTLDGDPRALLTSSAGGLFAATGREVVVVESAAPRRVELGAWLADAVVHEAQVIGLLPQGRDAPSAQATVQRWDRSGAPGPAVDVATGGAWEVGRLSPDGSALALWDEAAGLRVIDLAAGTTRWRGFPLGEHWIDSLRWSPDGRWLAVAAMSGDLAVVDTATGEVPLPVPQRPERVDEVAIDGVAAFTDHYDETWVFFPDEPQRPAVHLERGGEDLTVRGSTVYGVDEGVWRWDAGAGITWSNADERGLIQTPMAVSPAGDLVAYVYAQRELVLLDADGTERARWPLDPGEHGRSFEVFDLLFSADGTQLAMVTTGSEFHRNRGRIIEVATGALVADHPLYDSYGASALRDGVLTWRGTSPERTFQTTLDGTKTTVDDTTSWVAVGPDGQRKLGHTETAVVLIDGDEVRPLREAYGAHALSPDGRRALVHLGDGRLAVFGDGRPNDASGTATAIAPSAPPPGTTLDDSAMRLVPAFADRGRGPQPRPELDPDRVVPEPDPGPFTVEGAWLRRGDASWVLPDRQLYRVAALGPDTAWVSGSHGFSEIVDVAEGVVVARLEGTVRQMEVRDGELWADGRRWSWPGLQPLVPGPTHVGDVVAMAAHGSHVATGDVSGSVLVWRGDQLAHHLWGALEGIDDVALSEAHVAVAGRDGRGWAADVHRLTDGERVHRFDGYDGWLQLALSPDDRTLLVLVDDEYSSFVEARDLGDGSMRWRWQGMATDARFASHGRWVVLGGYTEEVTILDTATGAVLRELHMPRGFETAYAAAADDRVLVGASAHEDTEDRVWIPRTSDVVLDVWGGPEPAHDGRRVALGCSAWDEPSCVVVVDARGEELLRTDDAAAFLAWGDERTLHGVRPDHTLARWTVPAAPPPPEPDVLGHLDTLGPEPVPAGRLTLVRQAWSNAKALAVATDGRVAGAASEGVSLFDAEGEGLEGPETSGRCRGEAWFAPDGTLVATAGRTVRWRDGQVLSELDTCCDQAIADGERLICLDGWRGRVVEGGRDVGELDLSQGARVASDNGRSAVWAVGRAAWRYDGATRGDILARHWSPIVDVDMRGDQVLTVGSAAVLVGDVVLDGMPGRPQRAALSPDGERVAVGDDQGNVWVWSADGTPLAALAEPLDRLHDVAWSADGDHVITADGRQLSWWTAPSGR